MNNTILAVETSCDETAAAVYQEGRGVLSNILFSQIDLHKLYGGVVPEIASRSHLQKINSIVSQALSQAQVTLDDIDIFAVTNRPGLPGSLLIGICFTKAMAWAKHKPIIGVNHLEAHAFSAFLNNPIPFPSLCLTASGGHTSLYAMYGLGEYTVLGQTLDDAAGEAFDKIAKLLNLPYPGGPVIEKLAREVEFKDFYHYPRSTSTSLDFSFSGLKTAVLYDLVKRDLYDLKTKTLSQRVDHQIQQQVASSLLVCIADVFIQKLSRALKQYPDMKAISFVGGVACNMYIKQRLAEFCAEHNIQFFTPDPHYCTDNAAMVAFVAHYKAQQGKFSNYQLDISTPT